MTQLIHAGGVLGISFPWGQANVYQSEILVCLLGLVLWLGWKIWVWQRDWPAALAFLVAGVSGVSTFAGALVLYQYGANLGVAFDSVSSQALLFLVLITAFFTFSDNKPVNSVLDGFRLLCFVNSIVILVKYLLGYPPHFALSNPAMDASLIAVTYPLLCFKPGFYNYANKTVNWLWVKTYWLSYLCDAFCVVIPGLAILATGSTTGICAYVLASLACIVASRKTIRIGDIGIGLGFVALAAYLFGPAEFFSDSGRYGIWEMAYDFWREEFSPWFGSGLGTFFVFGPMIQFKAKFALGSIFVWMHNDWIQVLFETGILGLASVLILYVAMLFRTFRKPWLFSSIVTYGFIALTQMPLRLAPLAVLGGLLVNLSLRKP